MSASSFLSIFFLACAEPKYFNNSNPQKENVGGLEENKIECQATFSKSQLCINWYWVTVPTAKSSGTLIFKTFRPNILDQTAIELDLVDIPQVILWMPSMGHGSSPTKTERIDQGTYRTTNVFFIMPGEWEIRFQVKSGTEVVDETSIQLVF